MLNHEGAKAEGKSLNFVLSSAKRRTVQSLQVLSVKWKVISIWI